MFLIAARGPEYRSVLVGLTALQGWKVNAWKARLPTSTLPLFRLARFRKGLTLLHMMAGLDKADTVESMLSAVVLEELSRAASIQCEFNGQTALHYEAQNDHTAVTEAILTKLQPKDVVGRTKYERWTALHLAAKEGHENIVRLLLR